MKRALLLALVLVHPAAGRTADAVQQKRAVEHCRKGEEKLRAEQWDKAVEEFQNAVALEPTLVLAHFGMGQAYMALKNYAEAVAAFTGARSAFFQIVSSKMADRMRMADAGLQMLDEYKNLTGVDGRGNVQSGVNQRLNVLRDIELAKRQEDGGPLPPAEISLSLAGAWFRQGNLAEAEKENRAALASRPEYGQAHNNLAVIYMMTGRIPDARAEVDKAEKGGFAVNPKLKEELARRASGQP